MDSPNRPDFLAGLRPGGKYYGTVGIYRHNSSSDRIGLFDKEIVRALAQTRTVKWIAHNGAGYDQIDVSECAKHGRPPLHHAHPRLTDCRHRRLQHPRCGRRGDRYDGAIPHPLHSPPLFKGRALPARRHVENTHIATGHARSEHAHARHSRAGWHRAAPRAPRARVSDARGVPQPPSGGGRTRVVHIRRQHRGALPRGGCAEHTRSPA